VIGGLSQTLTELTKKLLAEAQAAGVASLPVKVGAESEINKVVAPPSVVFEPVSETIATSLEQRINPVGPRVLRTRQVTVRVHIYATDLDQAEALIAALVNAVQSFASANFAFGEATWSMGEVLDRGVAYAIPLTLNVPLHRRERRTQVAAVGPLTAELEIPTT
jgi:hypothetical protein